MAHPSRLASLAPQDDVDPFIIITLSSSPAHSPSLRTASSTLWKIVLLRQHVVKPKALERVLRPRRFQPGHRHGDALVAAFADQVEQDLRGGEVDLDHAAGFQHQQPWFRAACRTFSTSARKFCALRNDSGACRPTTAISELRSPGKCGLAGHQIVVSGHALELDQPRPRRAPDAVQQRQRDADRDALLDRQHDDRGGGGDDQQEFAERLAIDRRRSV